MDTSLITNIAPLVVIFAIMYFLVIRPQQQKAKQHQQMVSGIKRGDTVVTAGGLVGKVVKVKDDGHVLVEIADGVHVLHVQSTLSEVRSKDKAESKEDA